MLYRDFNQSYEKLVKIGEGSYGKVYLCSKKQNHAINSNENSNPNMNPNNTTQQQKNSKDFHHQKEYFALKKLKRLSKGPYSYSQNNLQDLRQIQILSLLSFPLLNISKFSNILQMAQILQQTKQYQTNHYIVFPFGIQILQFAKHKQILITKTLLKWIIKQIINGVKNIHKKYVIHRDIKPDNIFLDKKGEVKIGDFSLSRNMPNDKQNQKQKQEYQYSYQNSNCENNNKKMTGNVTTRYYRAPQIMYGSRNYTQKIDIWSLGCTIAQLILHQPIFPGQTDINQLQLIFTTIGYPQKHWQSAAQLPYYLQFIQQKPEKGLQNILPDVEPLLLDLISKCLQLDPEKRANIEELSQHQYLKEENDQNVVKQLQKIAVYLYNKKIAEYLQKNK